MNKNINYEEIIKIKEAIRSKLEADHVITLSKKSNRLKIVSSYNYIYEDPEYYKGVAGENGLLLFPGLDDFIACYNLNLDSVPICPYCGNFCKMRKNQYPKSYAKSCGNKECEDKLYRDLAKETFSRKDVIEKSRNTIKIKYGVDNISQAPEIKEKKKETCRRHFGVDFPFQSEEVIKTYKKNNIEKYGVSSPAKTKEIQDKIINTNLRKYGCPRPSMNIAVIQKIIDTNMEKYGYRCPLQNEKIRTKSRETLERHFREGTVIPGFSSSYIYMRVLNLIHRGN